MLKNHEINTSFTVCEIFVHVMFWDIFLSFVQEKVFCNLKKKEKKSLEKWAEGGAWGHISSHVRNLKR